MNHVESPSGPRGIRPSAASRALGLLEVVLAPIVHPRRAEDYLREVFPLVSRTEVRAEIVGVRRETADTTTLILRPNGLWQGHRAGQWLTLTAEIAGVARTRCFSIASAPSHGKETVEVTIKARPGGAVTPALVWQQKAGAIVTLSQAQGTFTLPEPAPRRPLFLSGGSGITPVMSMLRELALQGQARGVTFVHYARTAADVVFARELEEHGLFSGVEVLVFTDEEFHGEGGRAGGDVRADLPLHVADFAERETFACGPPGMLEAVAALYAEHEASERLHTEAFVAPRREVAARAVGGEQPEVQFARSAKSQKGGRTLLAMAESAGLTPKSGCRMGICHTCTCRKISGVTRDTVTGELSTDDAVDVRICVSEPVGPVVLDL